MRGADAAAIYRPGAGAGARALRGATGPAQMNEEGAHGACAPVAFYARIVDDP